MSDRFNAALITSDNGIHSFFFSFSSLGSWEKNFMKNFMLSSSNPDEVFYATFRRLNALLKISVKESAKLFNVEIKMLYRFRSNEISPEAFGVF